ncbi:PhzF family phenazine biosynthesis protein [Pseudoneobacillus sp. C159]
MWKEVYELSAFVKDGQGGNPAGVVLNTEGLNEKQMREIARELGYSETAFVLKAMNADFQIRYFTPKEEVDLCGHATIATFSLLSQKGMIQKGDYLMETKAGRLSVNLIEDGSVFLLQKLPEFSRVLPRDEIAASLGIEENELHQELPIQIVSTGLRDIIIPVQSLSILNELKPNFSLIKEISQKYRVVGYHVFTLHTLFGSTAHCRNFAPLYDIEEESATGTANAALACYLEKHGRGNHWDPFIFEQGYTMDRPSEILVHLGKGENGLSNVLVGGKSSRYKMKKILV